MCLVGRLDTFDYIVDEARMITTFCHIGFSLGGFLGLLNADKFERNYVFYPRILGITSSLVEKNYSNTVSFIATQDNWTKEGYDIFENLAL